MCVFQVFSSFKMWGQTKIVTLTVSVDATKKACTVTRELSKLLMLIFARQSSGKECFLVSNEE